MIRAIAFVALLFVALSMVPRNGPGAPYPLLSSEACTVPFDTARVFLAWSEPEQGSVPLAGYEWALTDTVRVLAMDTVPVGRARSVVFGVVCPAWGDSLVLYGMVTAFDLMGVMGDSGLSGPLVLMTPGARPGMPQVMLDMR